jgi:hypothetical protein
MWRCCRWSWRFQPLEARRQAPRTCSSGIILCVSGDRLIDEVTAWPGVTVEEGRFGSTRFMLGRRELGHVHGSSILDLPLPKTLRAELIERGVAIQHRFTPPESGWVTIELDNADAVERSIEILRERYEHAAALRDARAEPR